MYDSFRYISYSACAYALYKESAPHQNFKLCHTNGNAFGLSYEIILKDERDSKALIDNIRCKNANLNISLYQSED